MNRRFYNPYQFIPVTGSVNGTRPRTPVDPVRAGTSTVAPWVRHDLWHMDAVSGRMVCGLYLVTPTVLGAEQESETGQAAKLVTPYRWRGQPAVPGNTLKGMVSNLAEAISQSTLRVLESKRRPRAAKTLTYRITDPGGDPTGMPVNLATSIHDLFARIDPDLVPWYRRGDRVQRDALTPAELLFGVVEEVQQEAGGDRHANGSAEDTEGRNLAGRLRFHDARGAAPVRIAPRPQTLRVLNEPKLPCPAMYFHVAGERGQQALNKDDFHRRAHDDTILPNGRKVYLHHGHDAAALAASAWRTKADPKHDRLKLRVQPLDAGQVLYFHLDFENLAPAELTLLEYALAPGPDFCHRLGLGRPLGLGSVQLSVEGVFLIDRGQRYAADAFDECDGPDTRYHACWRPQNSPRLPVAASWATLYPTEAATLDRCLATKPDRYDDHRLIDTDTLGIVNALGDPAQRDPKIPVHTPLLAYQQDPEVKTYEWFNENDRRGGQALPAVQPGKRLTALYADWQAAPDPIEPQPLPPPDAAIAAWLKETLPSHVPVDDPALLAAYLKTGPLIEAWDAIPDATLKQEVLQWIKDRLRQHDPQMPLFNQFSKPARGVFKRAGVVLTND